MRILKLVIWDFDETILTGILEEGDDEVNPIASRVMSQLNDRGVLQALATQNQSKLIASALEKFGWSTAFVQIEADLGPKARKVRRILEALEINPLDTAFIDEDAFERDSIAAQFPGITTWTVADLEQYLVGASSADVTDEARRRPQMYWEQRIRLQQEEASDNYLDFLHACNIQITVRPYAPNDATRVQELLTRTHRMNLGVLSVDEAVARLSQPSEHHVVVAEMKDVYGDLGRCGIIHLTPTENREAVIESLAISCRTRARGLSLAMLVGLLRHPVGHFWRYRCRYINNSFNRPLRMLLMAAGFKSQRRTDWLTLEARDIERLKLPDWVQLEYQKAQSLEMNVD